jgi:hypothetical protein
MIITLQHEPDLNPVFSLRISISLRTEKRVQVKLKNAMRETLE